MYKVPYLNASLLVKFENMMFIIVLPPKWKIFLTHLPGKEKNSLLCLDTKHQNKTTSNIMIKSAPSRLYLTTSLQHHDIESVPFNSIMIKIVPSRLT